METIVKTEEKVTSTNVLISLIKESSEEITDYRKRQITTFREALIVQALVTWGVNHLNMEDNIWGWLIRILAGLSCFLVGLIGTLIIKAYKKRIYHMRKKRLELSLRIQEVVNENNKIESIFFPTEKVTDGKKIENMPTSGIYSFTIIMMGILTLLINILAGLAIKQ